MYILEGFRLKFLFTSMVAFSHSSLNLSIFVDNVSRHVGSRLIFFLSAVGNLLLILSVVSNIFHPLPLVG